MALSKIQAESMNLADTFAFTGTVSGASTNTGRRNLIINGDFKIWQRSISSTAANYSAPDRWYYGNAGTYSRSTDVPSGEGFQYSNSVKVTAATSYGVTAQRIEAVNCKHLVGKTVTASFWLKTITGSTGMSCVLYRANTEDGHASGATAIETKTFTGVTGTWTYYTLTWSNLPSETTNGLQLYFFSADAGTDPEYRITGIQLEVGSQATPFEHRSFGEELALCQRYFSKAGIAHYHDVTSGRNYGANTGLPTEMRANPTIVASSTLDNNNRFNSGAVNGGALVTKTSVLAHKTAVLSSDAGYYLVELDMDAEL